MWVRTNGNSVIGTSRWIPCFLLFWLAVFIGFFLAEQARCGDLPCLDLRIDGLERVNLLSGEEAIHAINKLHGMPIAMKRGFVAFYLADAGEKAVIWVSEAPSEELGEKQIQTMLSKMQGSSKSPFEKYRTVEAGNTKVIGFDGLGQVHYVFRIDTWVYWISADGKRVDSLLHHIIKGC